VEVRAVIDVKLLGPLVVTAGGRQVLIGPQQRVLLLTLLLARGRQVSSARLAELLWTGEDRERMPATLRSHVAHLRRAIDGMPGQMGPGSRSSSSWLVTERMAGGTAYAVRLEPERIDAARFEKMVSRGRDYLSAGECSEAAASFIDALALWRGRPFADIADRPFAADEVGRLEALHRAAWSGRVEAEVGLGRHREVIGELAVMVARWPDDEELRRLLAWCLARAGRTAEAAQMARDGIEHALSLGLDPSGMQALQAELLAKPRGGPLTVRSPIHPATPLSVGRPKRASRSSAQPSCMIFHFASTLLPPWGESVRAGCEKGLPDAASTWCEQGSCVQRGWQACAGDRPFQEVQADCCWSFGGGGAVSVFFCPGSVPFGVTWPVVCAGPGGGDHAAADDCSGDGPAASGAGVGDGRGPGGAGFRACAAAA